MMSAAPKRYRMEFTRNELSELCDALEEMLESLKWDGGLSLGESYMRLHNRIAAKMGLHEPWNLDAFVLIDAEPPTYPITGGKEAE